MCAARKRKVAIDFDPAAGEPREAVGSRDAFDLCPINAAMRVVRIEQAGIETGFVAEQQEALGIGVEPTQGINVFRKTEISERAPAGAGLRRELRKHAVGFVK